MKIKFPQNAKDENAALGAGEGVEGNKRGGGNGTNRKTETVCRLLH